MLIISKDIIGVSFPSGDFGAGARLVSHSIDHYITHRGFRWQFASVPPISTWDDFDSLPVFLKSTFLRQRGKFSSIFIDKLGNAYSSMLYVDKRGSDVDYSDIESEVAMYPVTNGQIYVFDVMPAFAEQMAGFLAVEGLKDLKKVQDFAVHMGYDGREIIWITHEDLIKRIEEKRKLYEAEVDKQLTKTLGEAADKYEKPDDEEAPVTSPKPKRRRRRSASAATPEPATPNEAATPVTPVKPKRKRRTVLDCVRDLEKPEPVEVAPEPPETQPTRRIPRRRRPVGV